MKKIAAERNYIKLAMMDFVPEAQQAKNREQQMQNFERQQRQQQQQQQRQSGGAEYVTKQQFTEVVRSVTSLSNKVKELAQRIQQLENNA